MPYFPLFGGSKGAPFVPPVGSLLIYSGGTVNPHSESWTVTGGVVQDGKDVYALDPDNVTEINASGFGLDGTFLSMVDLFNLATLQLYDNNLSALDIGGKTLLSYVDLHGNPNLASLNVVASLGITTLYLNNSGLVGNLDLTGCASLNLLDLNSSLYLTGLLGLADTVLQTLTIAATAITDIDISVLSNLQYFYAYNCGALTTATMGNALLEYATFYNNFALATLNLVSECSLLASLELSSTFIGAIDMTKLIWLLYFNVTATQLHQADLDTILAQLVANGRGEGTANLQVADNSQPTGGFANADYVILTTTNNWSVYLNPDP